MSSSKGPSPKKAQAGMPTSHTPPLASVLNFPICLFLGTLVGSAQGRAQEISFQVLQLS